MNAREKYLTACQKPVYRRTIMRADGAGFHLTTTFHSVEDAWNDLWAWVRIASHDKNVPDVIYVLQHSPGFTPPNTYA